jgi:hypothetical protein
VHLPVEVVVDPETTRGAVTKDISQAGLLLLTRARLATGQSVKLKIHRPADGAEPLVVSGTVVRRQPFRPEELGIWRERVAFAFHEPHPEFDRELAELAQHQAPSAKS